MAFEKRYAAIVARNFVSNGAENGTVELATTSKFKVKQHIAITATGEPSLQLEVKSVLSPTILRVGPRGGSINAFTNLTAYTVAKNAAILADEQPRAGISNQEIIRAVYDEEPTMALRSVMVDEYGNYWTKDNPLPTSAQIVVEDLEINVNLDGFKLVNPDSVISVGTEDGTKNGTKHALRVGNDLNLRVKDEESISLLEESNLLLENLDTKTDEINNNVDEIRVVANEIEANTSQTNTQLLMANASLDNIELLLQSPLQISQPIITAGTDDGTPTGNVFTNVNNIRNQILATADRDQQLIYEDFGTKNQRIVEINYTSPKFPGVIAKKTNIYILESGRYKRTNIIWSIE